LKDVGFEYGYCKSYDEAQYWLLEDEYEPIEGRLRISELGGIVYVKRAVRAFSESRKGGAIAFWFFLN